MKRAHFIQSMLTLTGTAFIYACRDGIDGIGDPSADSYESPTIDGAKKWFTDSYQGSIASARTQKTSVERTLDWDNSKKVKKGKHDYIWVPVKYEEGQLGTALLMWKPGEEYVQRLAQYLSWSISEGFIAYRKPNGEYDGFLAQMAFDPSMSDITKPVDVRRFTGLVINADLNENILRTWRFLEGKMVSYSKPENMPKEDKNGRVSDCTYTTTYTTVTGQSCGPNCTEVFYTLHTVNVTYPCDPANGSDPGYMGSGANNSGDWYGYGSGTGGNYPPPQPTPITNFTQLAINVGSWERITFNQRLTDAVTAVGLAAAPLDLSLTKAQAIANSLSLSSTGLTVNFVKNLTILGKSASGIGAATSLYSAVIGVAQDGQINWQDGLNSIAFGLGLIAVLSTNPVGWWALGSSALGAGISIGIAIYDANHRPNP